MTPTPAPDGAPAATVTDAHSTTPSDEATPQGDRVEDVAPAPADGSHRTFRVRLDNFDGPFDLLLQLISSRRMDVTEVALSQVTDDFVAHIRGMGDRWDLDQVTEFLVIAATLVEIKAARLLPQTDEDDESGLHDDLFASRDLLFARLLAYRAYQQVAALFAELEAGALRRYPRAVTLEPRYLGLLTPVRIGVTPEQFAVLAAAQFAPKPPPPSVNLDHIHASPVSVAEHTATMRQLLAERGEATFTELVAGCGMTLEVVARFLGLLNLYREAQVAFDQVEPLGPLTVRWTGAAPDESGAAGADGAAGGSPHIVEEYA